MFLPSVAFVPLYVMVKPIPDSSNTTPYPAFHSVIADMRECDKI